MSDKQSAFGVLAEVAGLTLGSAKGLPAQQDVTPHWSGIGFSFMGHRFIAAMGEITEMLEVPPYTRLPGVQSWVKGVSNVRGRLLPIIDLAEFFGGHLSSPRKQRRILVLEDGDLFTGLLVDQVFGMQHFPVDTFEQDGDSLEDALRPFVGGSYKKNDLRWTVFSASKLTQHSGFMNVALYAS